MLYYFGTYKYERMKQVGSGLLFIILGAILWGTAGISAKYIISIYPLSPLTIGAWRLFVACPILFLFANSQEAKKQPLNKQHFTYFLIYSLSLAGYQLAYFSAVKLILVSVATLIAICTSPVFVAIFSRIFIKEKITLQVCTALILSIIGTALIIDVNTLDLSLSYDNLFGYVLALVAGLSFAVVTLSSKKLVAVYSPIRINAISFALGAIFMLPFLPVPLDLPFKVWLLLFYLGIIPTALAYFFFTKGLKKTTATKAAIASLLEPLTSTILALTLIGEYLTTWQSLGAIFLLLSLVIISFRNFDRSR